MFGQIYTLQDIERLSKVGVTVRPDTIQHKLSTWEGDLDVELIKLRDTWSNEGELTSVKYQLVGDNWDKNILPSYRTSDRKTESLHLFNVIGVVDRVHVKDTDSDQIEPIVRIEDVSADVFIPSVEDQAILLNELTFMVAWSVILNVEEVGSYFEKIYPKHLDHEYSDSAGEKTKQVCLTAIKPKCLINLQVSILSPFIFQAETSWSKHMSRLVGKPTMWFSKQVRHKRVCTATATEAG